MIMKKMIMIKMMMIKRMMIITMMIMMIMVMMTRRSGRAKLKKSVGEELCAKNEIMTNGYVR